MLGDLILAEPAALVGFAGPRVIKETIGQDLPDGFQTSEYLLEHGMVDRIVRRADMRHELGSLLRQFMGLPPWEGAEDVEKNLASDDDPALQEGLDTKGS